MQTIDNYFKHYSDLFHFEEGPPQRLVDEEDFKNAVLQILEDYTTRIVENATITYTQEKTWDFTEVDKESITSQLEIFKKEIRL